MPVVFTDVDVLTAVVGVMSVAIFGVLIWLTVFIAASNARSRLDRMILSGTTLFGTTVILAQLTVVTNPPIVAVLGTTLWVLAAWTGLVMPYRQRLRL